MTLLFRKTLIKRFTRGIVPFHSEQSETDITTVVSVFLSDKVRECMPGLLEHAIEDQRTLDGRAFFRPSDCTGNCVFYTWFCVVY